MTDDVWEADEVRRRGDGELVEREYDQSGTPPSTAVIKAIASVEGVDPLDLSTTDGITLHNHVDPDALDRLLTDGGRDDLSITLSIEEYTVWMQSDKIAILDPANSSNRLE